MSKELKDNILQNNFSQLSLEDLLARREKTNHRLAAIGGSYCPSSLEDVGAVVKEQVHWDYVMKEMVIFVVIVEIIALTMDLCVKGWLANDFQKERQRHIGNAKKVIKAVDSHHKTKDAKKNKRAKVSMCLFVQLLIFQ